MSTRGLPAAATKRLALVAPSAEAVLRLFGGLIGDLARGPHKILCAVMEADARDAVLLKDLGAECRTIDLAPPGLRFFAERKAIASLVDLFQDWQPHIVVGFGSRPMVFAALAGKKAGVNRIVALCDGLPEGGFAGHRGNGDMPDHAYARALSGCNAAIFHNEDDLERFEARRILPHELPSTVVPGAGIDLEHHREQPLPHPDTGLNFLMTARLEKSRGVDAYAAAARELKAQSTGARFLLAGPPGRGDGARTPDELGALDGVIEYLGDAADPRAALAQCHVFVYPSHAEGMPRRVLEALAAGRPVITTDAPGCRDTVDEFVNGCLVPPGDAKALAAAMARYLKRPDLIPAAARASRVKAERRFDARAVNRALLSVLGLD